MEPKPTTWPLYRAFDRTEEGMRKASGHILSMHDSRKGLESIVRTQQQFKIFLYRNPRKIPCVVSFNSSNS
jgi:hypothetical protein